MRRREYPAIWAIVANNALYNNPDGYHAMQSSSLYVIPLLEPTNGQIVKIHHVPLVDVTPAEVALLRVQLRNQDRGGMRNLARAIGAVYHLGTLKLNYDGNDDETWTLQTAPYTLVP